MLGELIDRDEETDSDDDRLGDELSELWSLDAEIFFFISGFIFHSIFNKR